MAVFERLAASAEQVQASFTDMKNAFEDAQQLPPFASGQAILDRLAAIQQTLELNHRQLHDQLAQLEERLGSRISASNTNALARVYNSHAGDNQYALQPLVDAKSGEPIPSFPRTAGQLRSLNSQTITSILRALFDDHPLGSLEEKRQRLRVAIGLPGLS